MSAQLILGGKSLDNLQTRLPKQLCHVVYLGIIGLLICLPIFFSKGALFIGGDSILPFYAVAVKKFLWQWLDLQGGYYFALNYFSQYFYYNFFDLVTSDVYAKASLLLVFINAFSALGVYRLARLICGDADPFLYFLTVAFYLLSPARYNAWIYLQIYAFIPWFFYLTLKIIKSGKIGYSDVLWFNVIILGASLDLPNPKYLFYLFVILLISFVAAIASRKLKPDFFAVNLGRIVLFFSLSAYLYLPLFYFAFHYHPAAYGDVAVKSGYTNDSDAPMMDYGSTTADKMFRLFHNGMTLSPAARLDYLAHPLVTFSNFFFIVLIVIYFIRNRGPTFHDYLFLVLTLVYLFFAIGPNPPLGFIYRFFVVKFPLLAFLRTTAGAVFFLSLFYALLLFAALKYFRSGWLNALFVACLFLTSYPLLDGNYYRNWSVANNYINRDEYGLRVPKDYFKMKSLIDAKKLNARIMLPNSNLSYINTTWGYFGPAALYEYLYNGYFVGNGEIIRDLPKHNIGYVLWDNSLYPQPQPRRGAFLRQLSPGGKEGFLRFDSVKKGRFLPVVYAPSVVIQDNSSGKMAPPIDSAVLGVPQSLDRPLNFNAGGAKPIIEYKKINPSKYRVIAHGISGDFMLVLSEQFSDLWKIYIADYRAEKRSARNISLEKVYKPLADNEKEQATVGEVARFIRQGWITTLGNGRAKTITHRRYTPTRSSVVSTEKYAVDFISKDNFGTIQNDNLKNGGAFETLFSSPLNAEHRLVNGYANSWIIKPEKIKEEFRNGIIENNNGAFDVDLILEFYPQKIFNLSALISLISFVIVCGLGFKSYFARYRYSPANMQ